MLYISLMVTTNQKSTIDKHQKREGNPNITKDSHQVKRGEKKKTGRSNQIKRGKKTGTKKELQKTTPKQLTKWEYIPINN